MLPPGQIIILNGAPRSGKSSLAAVIQATFDGVWMNLGVDRFMAMTPKQYLPGIGLRPGGERPDLEPLVVSMYRAMYASIAAHSRSGLNVVVDVGHHDAHSIPRGILFDSARILSSLPVWFVGVRCPLEVILQRRHATGWDAARAVDGAVPLPVAAWQKSVHEPGIYDMEIDTSILSPEAGAELIRVLLKTTAAGRAFRQLAAMASD